ncbi:MAG: hypothetical protein ABEL76_17570, partial [Bradymonadaceae bacterium]
LARARLAYDRADFDRAVELAREILHLRRHDAIASFRARRVLIPIYLLRADFDAAERAIDACSRFLRGPALPVARVWLVRQIVRWNLALGRPDVALGRIDVLDARLDRSPLGSSPDVRAMLELSRAQSLIAGLYRDRMIGRNSSSRSGGDVKFAFGRLRDTLDSLSPPQRAECHRTFARWELLRGRPSRAMEELDDAVSALHDFPGPLARTLCAEAMGAVQKSKSSEESPTLLEQSQILREHWGCPSPLALEGWPVPDELSALQPDDE